MTARNPSLEQVRTLRLLSQCLHPRTALENPDPARLLKTVCAVQAQDRRAALLAFRARSPGLAAEGIQHALEQSRSIVRTWALRGTLHLVAARDLAWILPLLGPVFIRLSRRRWAELGLDENTLQRAVRVIRAALERQGHLTRPELAERLAAEGIPAEGQATPHLIRRAALEGVICFGPDQGGEPTFVNLKDWVDITFTPPSAQTAEELARRYLEGYAPAAPEDFAAWSGLSIRQARAAFQQISGQLEELEVEGAFLWMPKNASWQEESLTEKVVRLLPGYDPYLLGYRSREWILPAQHARRIHPGGGLLHPALVVAGQVVASWRILPTAHQLRIAVDPFEPLEPSDLPELEAEARDVGRFLGSESALIFAES